MQILTTFILVGMIDSFDAHFATVELNTTPASNGGPFGSGDAHKCLSHVTFMKVRFSMWLKCMS